MEPNARMEGDMEPQWDPQLETISKSMFKDAMKGKWEDVIKCYEKNPKAQGAKITRWDDTVLHLAVSSGNTNIVKRLVNFVANPETLRIGDHRGNTPLHFAATLGMVEMCDCLLAKDQMLITARNKAKETPLFLAALQGKKEAFLALHKKCHDPHDKSLCRRDDGDTILHCTISGEYFDLAFQIIYLYEDLVNFNNEKGELPLHLLANKPHAFRSGTRIRRLDHIIYSCVFVDPLMGENKSNGYSPQDSSTVSNHYIPENYQTCFIVWKILKDIVCVLVKNFGKWNRKSNCLIRDTENPQDGVRAEVGEGERKKENVKKGQPVSYGSSTSPQSYPSIYVTCFSFFKLIMKILLVILGLGFSRIQKMEEKKQKHKWACQIMDELVNRASSWEYDYTGSTPLKHPEDESSLRDSIVKMTEPPSEPPSLDKQPLQGGENLTVLHSELKPKRKLVKGLKKKSLSSKNLGEVMEKLVDIVTFLHPEINGAFSNNGMNGTPILETPILVAAKMGVVEIVEKILDTFPVAMQDMNQDGKNIVLLAVENRQPHVYRLMLKKTVFKESVFKKVDVEGNSALHLAATLGENRPWLIAGAALQMQWEIKWYKFVKASMDRHFFIQYNHEGQTPRDIFTKTHQDLVKDGGTWLTNTSQSCSVVAALIATVAFSSATTVPGGVTNNGLPIFEGKPAFDIFAISSLVALCFSVTSLIMFLSILTSRYQESDFGRDLPQKLIMGLTSLFFSIAAMLVSFCAGHFFVIKDKLKYATYPVYAVMGVPVTFFAMAQFPLYFDLIKSTIRKVPERTYQALSV
ncbi:uncharacterized protein LOC143875702 isoform X2 [Tasmannia lanceolata]|uniref:uncharacterized protein LOC143875702 isoform X2 n=1 Tax=Tasmannia lanceolata TaxID=3420 RepID=UPI0040640FC7